MRTIQFKTGVQPTPETSHVSDIPQTVYTVQHCYSVPTIVTRLSEKEAAASLLT